MLRRGRPAGADERGGARAGTAAADARPRRRDDDAGARRAARPAKPRSDGNRARRARASGRSASCATPNASYQLAANRAPTDPAINTGWGELFLQTEQNGEALKSFQAALEGRPALDAGAHRRRAGARRRQSAAGGRAREEGARNQSVVGRRVRVPGGSGDRRRQARRRPASCCRRRSRSIRRASTRTPCWPRWRTSKTSSRSSRRKSPRRSPSRRTTARCTASRASSRRTTTGSMKRSTLTRRALALDPDNAVALTALGTHLLRTGDEPAARTALERSFKLHPYSVVTFNLLGMMDKLDTFETIRDGDFIFRMPKDEVAGPPRVHRAAHPQGARRVSPSGYKFRLQGSDSHRGLRQARRLRRAERRPARAWSARSAPASAGS